MGRADLFAVWGNAMQPCVLFGDPRQLPLTVMTKDEKDEDGNYLNRFFGDGSISALGFISAVGIPVYRLKTKLRMANGMFDVVSKAMYPDVPFEYAGSCDIKLPQFQTGRDLEQFIQEKFPDVKAPPHSRLSPLFINCRGSRVWLDKLTGSRKSPDQVKVALDFAVDLIRSKKIPAKAITVLSPYAANVSTVTRMRKLPEYAALSDMPATSTIDSFQGQENDIAIVIMSTTTPGGPGFTSDPQRLNVMLTRQKCGLVVVGDIKVTGSLDKKDKKKTEQFIVVDSAGNKHFTKAVKLKEIHSALWDQGRVVTVECGKATKVL